MYVALKSWAHGAYVKKEWKEFITAVQIASHSGVFRGARISSLPTNACSTEDNIPFPLLYSPGKWPINSFEIKCWQAKHDS